MSIQIELYPVGDISKDLPIKICKKIGIVIREILKTQNVRFKILNGYSKDWYTNITDYDQRKLPNFMELYGIDKPRKRRGDL